jgi:hypothetical protein
MSLQIEENTREVLTTLQAQAEARNMGLADYLRLFAEAGEVGATTGDVSLEEFEALLDQLAEAPAATPSLAADFSRADIYADHD